MKRKLKLGFIGGGVGSIAGYPHFIASQMDQRFKVVAGVFSHNKERNQETASKFKVKCYNSTEKMLQNEQLDVVAVLTPTPRHFEDIKMLLKRDIPIICEKPLVSSYKDAIEVQNLSKNKFLTVTYNYSGYPMIRELKDVIESGRLGKIISIDLKMPQESFLRPPKSHLYPQQWRLKDGDIPMIALDLGVHLQHLAFFLLGKRPTQILSTMNNFSKYDVVDDMSLLLKYQNNMIGKIWISKVALGERNGLSVSVYGTNGSATWIQENSETLNLAFQNGDKLILDRGGDCAIASQKRYNRMTPGHPSGFIEAFANLYFDTGDCLDEWKSCRRFDNPYLHGISHSVDGLSMFYKARISHKTNQWVDL